MVVKSSKLCLRTILRTSASQSPLVPSACASPSPSRPHLYIHTYRRPLDLSTPDPGDAKDRYALRLSLQSPQLLSKRLPDPVHVPLPLEVVAGRLCRWEGLFQLPGDLEDA